MKNLYLVLVISLILSLTINSQSYVIDWETNNNEVIKISIEINLKYSTKAIKVRKSFDIFENSQKLEQNTLVLIGDFRKENQNILLNYEKYYYYFLPFDPNIPFLNVNRNKNLKRGIIQIGNSQGRNSGSRSENFWYWCTCGGHNRDSPNPGGCLSSLEGNIIRCVPDGGSCPNNCIGEAVEDSEGRNFPNSISGGGILIQTEKSLFTHDFQTGAGRK